MKLVGQRGFGLIEVLVAFVVIAAGAAALVKLQSAFLTTTAESGAREAAMHLAETKLDDLRSFEVVATTSGKVAYQDIGNNSGGQIASGAHTIGQQALDLSWTVSNQFLTSPANVIPERKDATVTVSWIDRSGTQRNLSLSGAIARSLSIGSTLLSGSLGAGQPSPQVKYNKGIAPDVIAIGVATGTKVETSKPMPTVFQKGNTVGVQFESVTYDANTNKLIQHDQLTLACTCNLQSGESSQSLPDQLSLTSYGLYWVAGDKLSKSYGASTITQEVEEQKLCTLCCSNHFDGTSTSSGDFKLYYNQDIKGLHTHASSYNESCRLLRVDGLYTPMPDWNLAVLNVMTPAFLTDDLNQANYQKYVQAVVKAHVSWQKSGKIGSFSFADLNTWLGTSGNVTNGGATTTAVTVGLGPYQLIARGVYVDYMKSEYLSSLDLDDVALLSKVPFNEVNLTLLANWSVVSADQAYVTVTSQPVQTIVDVNAAYYGVYSRGRITAIQDSMTAGTGGTEKAIPVSATIRRSNSGISAGPAIGTDALSAMSPLSASLSVKVHNVTVDKVNVHGTIKCLSDPTGNSTEPKVCTAGEWNNLTITAVNASCTLTKPTGQTAGTYSCFVTRGESVTATLANSGYLFKASDALTFSGSLTNPGTGVSISQGPCVLMVKSTVAGASYMSACTN